MATLVDEEGEAGLNVGDGGGRSSEVWRAEFCGGDDDDDVLTGRGGLSIIMTPSPLLVVATASSGVLITSASSSAVSMMMIVCYGVLEWILTFHANKEQGRGTEVIQHSIPTVQSLFWPVRG